jgi:tetratricopeptide (TPR) repeat protein
MNPDEELTPELVEELKRAAEAPRRNEILERHPELRYAPAVLRLTEIARETLRVSPPDSLSLAEAALAIAQRIGETPPLARALRAKANALWFLNRNQDAVALYDEAVRLFGELGDETEVGRTLSSSLQPLIRLGHYPRAFDDAERARAIFRKSGDTLRLARLDLNVANIFHRQDRFAEALEMYERAYPQFLPHSDQEGIAVALHNTAVCLIALNDLGRAQATYRTAPPARSSGCPRWRCRRTTTSRTFTTCGAITAAHWRCCGRLGRRRIGPAMRTISRCARWTRPRCISNST